MERSSDQGTGPLRSGTMSVVGARRERGRKWCEFLVVAQRMDMVVAEQLDEARGDLGASDMGRPR